MKLFLLGLLLSLLAWLGTCSPVHPENQFIQARIYRRSPQKNGLMNVKGQRAGSREYNPTPPPLSRAAPTLQLRKGQYRCGNRVCRLRPGEVPAGCDGMCQYAVS